MSRPLRIEYSGAWYHVMNRGLSRQTVFHTSKSYQIFLDLLKEVYEHFQIQIHAYCLMSNHYHLLVRTPLPNLGRGLRHIDGVYTVRNNRLIGRDGPLFRGRYKAILIEEENYLLQVSRYIHLNPCAAKLVKFPEDYCWSSFNNFINNERLDWLFFDETLKYFSSDKINGYKKFVMDGLEEGSLTLTEKFPILGSEEFIRKIKEEKLPACFRYEIPQHQNTIKRFYPTFNEVISAVALYYSTSKEDVLNGDLQNSMSRKIAIYLSYQLTGKSYKLLATEFKNLSMDAFAKICQRVSLDIKNNQTLLKDIHIIKNLLSNVQT